MVMHKCWSTFSKGELFAVLIFNMQHMISFRAHSQKSQLATSEELLLRD